MLANNIRLVDMRTKLHDDRQTQHQAWYDASEKGLRFKASVKTIQKLPWLYDANLKAKEVKLINHLVTNHSYDKRWLHRFGKEESDECNTCHAAETAQHLVFECSKYAPKRNLYLNLSQIKSTREMLESNKKHLIIRDIIKFTKECYIHF